MKNKFTKTVLMAVAVLGLFVTFTGKVQADDKPDVPFIGELRYVAFGFYPKDWLPCNGQLLNISKYGHLFGLIGNKYGGDGRLTFGLPDMRGRVPVMAGQGPGLSKYALGEKGGAKDVKLVDDNVVKHTHIATAKSTSTVSESDVVTLNAYNGAATKKTAEGNSLSDNTGDLNTFVYSDQSPNVAMKAASVIVDIRGLKVDTTTDVTVNTGAKGFSIMQPYIVINCIIATLGLYPPGR